MADDGAVGRADRLREARQEVRSATDALLGDGRQAVLRARAGPI
jgi:hypothetical protein